MKKKVLSIFVSFVFVFVCLAVPSTVFASDEVHRVKIVDSWWGDVTSEYTVTEWDVADGSPLPTFPPVTENTHYLVNSNPPGGEYTPYEYRLLRGNYDPSLGVTEDLVYERVFKRTTYNIYYYGNGGKWGNGQIVSEFTISSVKEQQPLEFLLSGTEKPNKVGYKFLGWYTAKNGGTKVTKSTVIKWDKDLTLYAHWEANKYTLTLKANAAKGKVAGKPKVTKSVTFDKKIGKLATPKRAGFKFKGWYTAKKGGKKITATSKYVFTREKVMTSPVVNYPVGKSTTLYAHWQKIR
jgi:uncharacterized repeat protein (TIGR02543 family)